MLYLRKKPVFAAILAVIGVSVSQANTAEASQRLLIAFQKSPVPNTPGVWSGNGVANDGTPVLVGAVLSATRDTGQVTHVERFQFSFTPAGTNQTVVVDMVGIINNRTGQVVLNGSVDSSNHPSVRVGTRAHLSGQVTNSPVPFTIVGRIYMTLR